MALKESILWRGPAKSLCLQQTDLLTCFSAQQPAVRRGWHVKASCRHFRVPFITPREGGGGGKNFGSFRSLLLSSTDDPLCTLTSLDIGRL